MAVDTSALVASLHGERGSDLLLAALLDERGVLIAPAHVEFRRVTALADNQSDPDADLLLATLHESLAIVPFDVAMATAAAAANENYGTGNGIGGKLNMLDLMIYGAAKEMGLPVLCTGKDFARTDAVLHPASRRD